MNTDIKIGVSLYSLSTEFIHGTLDLEGCLRQYMIWDIKESNWLRHRWFRIIHSHPMNGYISAWTTGKI